MLRSLLTVLLALALFPSTGAAQAPAGEQTPSQKALRDAVGHLQKGNSPAAIGVLEPFAKDPQAEPTLKAVLGALYVEAGRNEDALEILEPLAAAEDADAAVLYNTAQASMAVGKTQEGIALLERSAARSPLSPAARDLGMLMGSQGRIREAFRLLAPWARYKPDDLDARQAAAAGALRLNRFAEAKEFAAGLSNDRPGMRAIQAEIALVENKPRVALDLLAPMLASGTDVPKDVYRLAADAHLRLKEADKAQSLLANRASGDPQLSLLLAQAVYQQGDGNRALEILQPFATNILESGGFSTAKGLSAGILLEQGRILTALGRAAEASRSLNLAAELTPNDRQVWQNLAQALAADGKREEAQQALQRFQDLTQAEVASTEQARQAALPGNLEAVYEALRNRQPERALQLLETEIGRDPKDLGLRQMKLRVLLSMQRYDLALASAEETVAAAPNVGEGYYQRGAARLAMGQAETGEADLRRALQIEPTHSGALNDLAVLLMTRKAWPEAKELLERALSVNPGDVLAQDNLRKLQADS